MKIILPLNNKTVFHKPGLSGQITISQRNNDSPTVFEIKLSGLQKNHLHGIHIHENSVSSKEDLKLTCDSCGGHFNPTKKKHGSIFNKDPHKRHVGDLINNLKSDENGECQITFSDNLAVIYPTLESPYTIVGKSIVVHEGTDDLGREGFDHKIPYITKENDKIVIKNNKNKILPMHMKYEDVSKRKSSLENGNAGSRILCATII